MHVCKHCHYSLTDRITADESLFWYRYTWDTSVYTDVNFEPVYLDMASAAANNATVIDACNNDAACIYDTLVTESQEIGVYTSTVEAEVTSNAKVLRMSLMSNVMCVMYDNSKLLLL